MQNQVMEMVELETVNRVWRVSRQYRLMIINHLRSCSSLTIKALSPNSTKVHHRMLTFLSMTMSLKHFHIINTISMKTLINIMGVIGRNSRTLTSIRISFPSGWSKTHQYEMNAFYFLISSCRLLAKLTLHGALFTKDAATRAIVHSCPQLEIVPGLTRFGALEILPASGTINDTSFLLGVSYVAW
jgi:hypothetical protein